MPIFDPNIFDPKPVFDTGASQNVYITVSDISSGSDLVKRVAPKKGVPFLHKEEPPKKQFITISDQSIGRDWEVVRTVVDIPRATLPKPLHIKRNRRLYEEVRGRDSVLVSVSLIVDDDCFQVESIAGTETKSSRTQRQIRQILLQV